MEEIPKLKRGCTQERWLCAIRDKAFDPIRTLVVLETRAEDFLRVLEVGSVSTHSFLRRIHAFALDMNWLPWPVLPRKRWPVLKYKPKRAITWEEHQKILAGENNPEWHDYYELLWHLGGSQSDVAALSAGDVDWSTRTIGYARQKTGSMSLLRFGEAVEATLKRRPQSGMLFPMLGLWKEADRGKAFIRRCKLVGVSGVSLHCYRYAWAERAKRAGYPERFAQAALGHNSKAVHRAYARNAHVGLPSLESYEKAADQKIVPLPRPEADAIAAAGHAT
jgi:integrase